MSQSSWLVAGIVPGIARHPLKKLAPDQDALLNLLHRWRAEAGQAGREISRIAVAFEAGRDGFWLARWLRAHGIEAHVIHPTSIAVSREHRRAKTDRLDTGRSDHGCAHRRAGWWFNWRGHWRACGGGDRECRRGQPRPLAERPTCCRLGQSDASVSTTAAYD
jgi:hypothetical protein